MGREIKFKPATFYLGITDYLARIVEGQEARQPRYSEDGREEIQERADSLKDSESREIRKEGERAEMVESLTKGGEEGESSTVSGDGQTNVPPLHHETSSTPSHSS